MGTFLANCLQQKRASKAVKMRGIIAGCTFATLLLAVAWADHHGHHGHHDHHEPMCHMLSSPNADFAFALYKSLNAKAAAGTNIFFSPLGLSSALSMLTAGAGGETHRQLFHAMGYSAHNQTHINEAYQHIFSMLENNKDQRLFISNGAAVRFGFAPASKFIEDIKSSYQAKVFNVHFDKPEQAAAEINEYILERTQGMIKDQVKDLDPEMAMVLINSVYFSGAWEKPFDANLTETSDFHVDATTTVQVPMMKRMGRYDFYQDVDNHTSVIMLPYRGNSSMMIVLPDEGKMQEVEGYINAGYIQHWHDSLYRTSVDVFLPKFSTNVETPVESTLKEMGIVNVFENSADLSGISEEVKLKVSKISHKAALRVFETGSEAAASTTMEVMPMSLPETMRLDRPFLLFILEHSTKSIVFMGKINNPV